MIYNQENMMINIDNTDLMEKLAKKVHEIWTEWYIHQRDNATAKNIKRWERQASQNYDDLSDIDKEKDRKIVRRVLQEIPDDFFLNK